MKTGITKQINIFFTFDSEGDIIDGSKEGTNDSRFLGITYFKENGERSYLDGKSATKRIMYANMTTNQKEAFDVMVNNHIELKGE